MNVLVRIDEGGQTFSVWYTEDVKFGTFNISNKSRVHGSFVQRMKDPYWLTHKDFVKFVEGLFEQYIANQVLDVYDEALHEYRERPFLIEYIDYGPK